MPKSGVYYLDTEYSGSLPDVCKNSCVYNAESGPARYCFSASSTYTAECQEHGVENEITGATGGSVVVNVTVMNAATSGVLSGARVEITLGSWTSSGTTNKEGKVSFTVSPQAPIGSTGVIKTSHKDFITQADSRLIQDKPNSFKIYLQSSLPTPEVGEVLGAASVAVILKVQSSTNSAALAGANVQFYFGGVEYNGQTNAQGSLIIGLRPDAPFGQSALITVSLAGYTTKVEFYVINSTPPLQGITILLVPGGNGRYYG